MQLKSIYSRTKILPYVLKPGRYLGNEINSVHKDNADVKIVLAFPDVYEIGMSYLGFKILYEIINSRTDSLAERVYAPWPDMLEELNKNNVPLFSLESWRPLRDFNIVGFTLQSELCFTNVVLMLEYSGIPILAKDRNEKEPLIIAGGSCCFNPEPLAEIFDFFVIGEGEEIINEIIDVYKKNKDKNRVELLKSFGRIEGIYVPFFYDVIKKRIVSDFENAPASIKPPVPYINIVHDRFTLEIMRGCRWNCRFCMAGNTCKPVRVRSINTLIEIGKLGIKNTGYDEISLLSLNTADYKNAENLISEFTKTFHKDNVSISLPSLRIDLFSKEIACSIRKLRKPGLTFAPETGTERLRKAINKNISNDELFNIADVIFDSGWNLIKLYFMVGLPTETFSDVEEIVHLVKKIKDIGKAKNKNVQIHLSVAAFIPKPHTYFQFHSMDSLSNLKEKINFLIKKLGENVKWHNPEQSFIEAVFARGDRKLSACLIKAYKLGCKFDAWNEYFNFELWQKAFKECSIDPLFYLRERKSDEVLPWSIIKLS